MLYHELSYIPFLYYVCTIHLVYFFSIHLFDKHNKVLPYSSTSEEELQGYINFLKSKGFIKEADPNHVNPQQPVQQNGTGNVPDLGGLDIANL